MMTKEQILSEVDEFIQQFDGYDDDTVISADGMNSSMTVGTIREVRKLLRFPLSSYLDEANS